MTREQAYHYVMDRSKYEMNFNAFEDMLDIQSDYILSLEQRIAELESHKTCEGCKWFYGESQECMSYCARGFADKYEPKKGVE